MRIYLDNAASTPVDKRVVKTMLPFFSEEFGNPGSLHSYGQKAMTAVDSSREKIAKYLKVDFRQIIFTGSATEANNMALRGAVQVFKKENPGVTPRLIISAIEHESILATAEMMAKEGVEVTILPVKRNGTVDLDALKISLKENTVLVSVMYVNNETGAVQPILKIGEIIKERKKGKWPLFHTDAAQALAYLECAPKSLEVDLMTISAQKVHGPKGVGALYINDTDPSKSWMPQLAGGGQEFGLRSSTENVPGIVGFGKAVELLDPKKDAEYVRGLKDRFESKLIRSAPGMKINLKNGSPHILNIRVPGHDAEDMIVKLDLSGLAVSSGSACRSRSFLPSYVLTAMGLTEKERRESLRISFSRMTTKEEVDQAVKMIARIVSSK